MIQILQSLPQLIAAIIIVLGAVSALASALAALFRVLAMLLPSMAWIAKAAPWLDHFGVDTAGLKKRLSGIFGVKAADPKDEDVKDVKPSE
jgi:hypothetical protein